VQEPLYTDSKCEYDYVIIAVEGYLAKNKDGAYGITGEGSLLDNAAGKCSSIWCLLLALIYIVFLYTHDT